MLSHQQSVPQLVYELDVSTTPSGSARLVSLASSLVSARLHVAQHLDGADIGVR
jgi:hypothetical protein